MSDSTDRIINAVQGRLGGVTDGLVDAEIANAAEEFYRMSRAWRTSQKLTLRTGKRDHIMVLPNTDAQIVEVHQAGRADALTDQLVITPVELIGTTDRRIAQFIPPYILRLQSARTEDEEITVILILTAASLDAFPEALLDQHHEGIADMALGRLYAIPQRPWTSPQMSLYHSRRAARAVSLAKLDAQQGYSGVSRFVFPFFA